MKLFHYAAAEYDTLTKSNKLSSLEAQTVEKHHRELLNMQGMINMLYKAIDAKLEDIEAIYQIEHKLEA